MLPQALSRPKNISVPKGGAPHLHCPTPNKRPRPPVPPSPANFFRVQHLHRCQAGATPAQGGRRPFRRCAEVADGHQHRTGLALQALYASNKCHASSNKCLTSSNKKLLDTISLSSFRLEMERHRCFSWDGWTRGEMGGAEGTWSLDVKGGLGSMSDFQVTWPGHTPYNRFSFGVFGLRGHTS